MSSCVAVHGFVFLKGNSFISLSLGRSDKPVRRYHFCQLCLMAKRVITEKSDFFYLKFSHYHIVMSWKYRNFAHATGSLQTRLKGNRVKILNSPAAVSCPYMGWTLATERLLLGKVFANQTASQKTCRCVVMASVCLRDASRCFLLPWLLIALVTRRW